ncbi:MAG: hypothetical protein JJ896_08060 [Rhodothermales bacterium]|nr:hypothetical protein [Rhodothermales bacterium]MBO6779595.1 hypothetical protein [Rhodothermales bacterium]
MLFLALAIASSLAIGAMFKFAGQAGLDTLTLLVVNYAVAAGMGLLLLVADDAASSADYFQPGFLGLVAVTGLVLIGSFFLFAEATRRAGMSVSMAVMRVGVSIPFLVSWLAWREEPSSAQWIGFMLVLFALIFITRKPSEEGGTVEVASAAGLLVLLFVGGGAGDTLVKAFDVWFAGELPGHAFMGGAFLVSFLAGASLMLARRDCVKDSRAARWGLVLGVVNYASILFVLEAVARIPATVVFPTVSVSVVVGGALIGLLVWKERLSPVNMAGIALAAAAVVLLNG